VELGTISKCNLKPIKRIHMQHRAANAGGHKMHRASLLTPAKRLFTGWGGLVHWCIHIVGTHTKFDIGGGNCLTMGQAIDLIAATMGVTGSAL